MSKDKKQVDLLKPLKESNKKETKSDKMRGLYEEGMSVADITRKLGVCYSFTYQVCKRFSQTRNDKEFSTNQEEIERKADLFRKDWDEGLSIGEIAKKYQANYSYVWTVINNYRKVNA